jgi:hypothetical protein
MNGFSPSPVLHGLSPNVGLLKADSHVACSSPCHAVPLRVWNVSFPFDLHSAAVSDLRLPCRTHSML